MSRRLPVIRVDRLLVFPWHDRWNPRKPDRYPPQKWQRIREKEPKDERHHQSKFLLGGRGVGRQGSQGKSLRVPKRMRFESLKKRSNEPRKMQNHDNLQ